MPGSARLRVAMALLPGVLLALSLAPVARAEQGYTPLPCPAFTCQRGNFVYGKFVDRNDPEDEATTREDGVLRLFYFQADDFPYAFPDVTGGRLGSAQEACAQACEKHYNVEAAANGWALSKYWMFEQTCEDGPGGQCMCMAPDVCEPTGTRWWSDQWQEDWEYGQFFAVPANYTTGKVCHGDIQGDPHFTGADGSRFEFSGTPNQAFSIISDAHVQVNAFLGGRYGPWGNRIKAMTWIRSVAVMWGHHVAVLSARHSASTAYGGGYMDSILVDGEPLEVPPHGSATAAGGDLVVSWPEVKMRSGEEWEDQFVVRVAGCLTLRLTLRPEVRNLRTAEDAVIHLDLQVDSAQLSSNAHGVLGQTFRPDFVGRLAEQKLVYSPAVRAEVVPGDNAEGFIDGSVGDYRVRDLLKADCNFCRFARGSDVDEETARAMALAAAGRMEASVARKLL